MIVIPTLYQTNFDPIPNGIEKGTAVSAYDKQLQVVLAGTLTGVQDDIWCKVLAALSTVK